jgi:hypothetical protein
MKSILLVFFFTLNTISLFAQHIIIEDDDYKHSNTMEHKSLSTFPEKDRIYLRDQKTQKARTRKYIVAPSNTLPDQNSQGKKSKANYKNQFN